MLGLESRSPERGEPIGLVDYSKLLERLVEGMC